MHISSEDMSIDHLGTPKFFIFSFQLHLFTHLYHISMDNWARMLRWLRHSFAFSSYDFVVNIFLFKYSVPSLLPLFWSVSLAIDCLIFLFVWSSRGVIHCSLWVPFEKQEEEERERKRDWSHSVNTFPSPFSSLQWTEGKNDSSYLFHIDEHLHILRNQWSIIPSSPSILLRERGRLHPHHFSGHVSFYPLSIQSSNGIIASFILINNPFIPSPSLPLPFLPAQKETLCVTAVTSSPWPPAEISHHMWETPLLSCIYQSMDTNIKYRSLSDRCEKKSKAMYMEIIVRIFREKRKGNLAWLGEGRWWNIWGNKRENSMRAGSTRER